jgi:hypothetical protein
MIQQIDVNNVLTLNLIPTTRILKIKIDNLVQN